MLENEIFKYLKKKVKTRKDIPKILKKFNMKLVCEVGVKQGFNFKRLARANLDHLVGIDIWDLDRTLSQERAIEVKGWEQDLKVWTTKQKFNVQLIKDYSLNAVNMFEDGYFDYIYIDADHRYKTVKQDIGVWWKKVKRGGILAGHDYSHSKNKALRAKGFGVKKAVREFILKNNLSRNLYITKDLTTTSFIILKY